MVRNCAGSGRKEMTPSSKVRRFSSSGMREASMRCTVTLDVGKLAAEGVDGRQQVHAGVLVGRQLQLAALQALQLAEGAGGLAAQRQQAQRVVAQQSARRRSASRRARRGRRAFRPPTASSLRMTWLTAGWVRCRRTAAREKLRSSATARKVSSWLSSMASPSAASGSVSLCRASRHVESSNRADLRC